MINKDVNEATATASSQEVGADATDAIPMTKYGQIGFDKAIKHLYGKKLDAVTSQLKSGDPSSIPKKLSAIINAAIQQLEVEGGEPMPIELAAEVGMRLHDALVEDMVSDEVIPEPTDEETAKTIAFMMSDYANDHPDAVSPEQFQQFLQQLQDQSGDPSQDPLGQGQGMPQGRDMPQGQGMPQQPSRQDMPPQQQGLLGA